MVILALDSTMPAGSVALWRDDRLVEVRTGDPTRTHAERLPADLIALLAAHGTALADVDMFAVVAGPGGFTGLRVGIAAIQGLALVGQRPVFAASALLLLALAAKRTLPDQSLLTADHDVPSTPLVGALMHAARGEVFSALYRPSAFALRASTSALRASVDKSADESAVVERSQARTEAAIMARVGLVPIDDAAVDRPDVVATRWYERQPSAHLHVVGDAISDLAGPLRARFGHNVDLSSPPPLASVLAMLAATLPDLARSPHAVVPTYVRVPDAELARARRRDRPSQTAVMSSAVPSSRERP